MIIIIGAGLSGLLTAYRLKKEGIPFKILEARSRIGGRIDTVYGSTNTPVEMGATWFGDYHKNLVKLLDELEITYFEQYMKGTVFFQPLPTSPAQSIQIPTQPSSYRISGGTAHLIDTLYQSLDASDVSINQTVTAIKFGDNSVQVTADAIFEGTAVILAIPPKLWAQKIIFQPDLPLHLTTLAKETHTWMEDSIKVALSYAEPFWEQQNLSGTLFSNTGPITEFYDHCNQERSTYALCGFINSSFKSLSAEDRYARVMNQLKSVFGTDAEAFIDYTECIWSHEEYTYATSVMQLFPHQNNGNPIYSESYFDNRLFISSAEASPEFSGYMDGAVYIGNVVAERIINNYNLIR